MAIAQSDKALFHWLANELEELDRKWATLPNAMKESKTAPARLRVRAHTQPVSASCHPISVLSLPVMCGLKPCEVVRGVHAAAAAHLPCDKSTLFISLARVQGACVLSVARVMACATLIHTRHCFWCLCWAVAVSMGSLADCGRSV